MILANADEPSVVRQVDRVEAIRASMNKERTLMLLRMRQVLSPEQRAKLGTLHDQWEKDHRRQRGDRK
jgi:Spy/CpxP family protein refolding chaperone